MQASSTAEFAAAPNKSDFSSVIWLKASSISTPALAVEFVTG